MGKQRKRRASATSTAAASLGFAEGLAPQAGSPGVGSQQEQAAAAPGHQRRSSCLKRPRVSIEAEEPLASTTRRVRAGKGEVNTLPLIDSTPLLKAFNWKGMRSRLEADGYLMLRGVISRDQVVKARRHILHQLHHHKPGSFASNSSPSAALAAKGAANIGLLGLQDLAASHPVRNVLESPELFDLMGQLFQDPKVVTTAFKWLRAVAPGEFTGVHTDQVFLGRGSSKLLTAWVPLGDCPVEQGAIMVIPQSHKSDEFASIRRSYGASEAGSDGTVSGWLTDDGSEVEAFIEPSQRGQPLRPVQWHTSDLKAGDLVVLSLDVIHMSAANQSDKIRISCDTRWLPALEERDPRLRVWNGPHAQQQS